MILDLIFVAKLYKHKMGFIFASRCIDAHGVPLWVRGTERNSLC